MGKFFFNILLEKYTVLVLNSGCYNFFFSNTWENYHIEWMWGQDIRDSTVGFFGFGGIGQTIAKRLKGFDIDRILYTTRKPINEDLEKEFKATKVPFHELLGNSDILFIAAPLTPETEGIFNATAFGKMKKNAVLVNIARGRKFVWKEMKKKKYFF